jgi:hypothetical protein
MKKIMTPILITGKELGKIIVPKQCNIGLPNGNSEKLPGL